MKRVENLARFCREVTPHWEALGQDACLDISGSGRLWGYGPTGPAGICRRALTALGPLAGGAGPTRLTARLASWWANLQPGVGWVLFVPPGNAAVFLSPFPVSVLAPEGGAVTRLRNLGVRTLGDLQVVPDDLLLAVFGTEGKRWASLARGVDQAGPRNQITSPSQSIILVSWNGPLVSREEISALIEGLAIRLVALCPGGGASRTFWELVGRFPHGSRRVRASGSGDSTLAAWRSLLSHLLHLLERHRQGLLGLELRGGPSLASAGTGQINLFPACEAQVRLADALERINRRCPGSMTTASEHLLFRKGVRWECAP